MTEHPVDKAHREVMARPDPFENFSLQNILQTLKSKDYHFMSWHVRLILIKIIEEIVKP